MPKRNFRSVSTKPTLRSHEQSRRHSLGSPAILVLNYQWASAIARGLFALSLPYSVSTNSEQPPTEKFSEPFFLSSITRYILLSSILSRRKTLMRISCTTSSSTFATRRNPHRFEECHAALCHHRENVILTPPGNGAIWHTGTQTLRLNSRSKTKHGRPAGDRT
jgi:hypothetical protein